MKMSNSPLVAYTRISPNRTSPRNHAIDTITIHCVVGQCTAETLGGVFAPESRDASSNYGVDKDGRVGMYCEEKDRSWCTSSGANDNRAITIEVASDTTHPYAVRDKAYDALVDLCEDICRRNGIKALLWNGDKSLIGQPTKQNMTVHRWFANKACPGDVLYNLHGAIAEKVNARLGAAEPVKPSAPVGTGNDEETIWNYFEGKGLNAFAVAGLMGNLYAESALKSSNLQNSFEQKLGHTDSSYTAAVDNGKYGNFVKDSAGYGLAQWTFHTRKQALLDFAKAAKASIGSLAMQLDFLWKELQGYAGVMKTLKAATSVRQASDAVLLDFERPADQSEAIKVKRAGYGQTYYNKYAGNAVPAPSAGLKFKTGDTVQFSGGAVYTSSNAAVPAHSRGKSVCTVSQTYKGRHPYHLISSDGTGVHGWVDEGDAAALGTAEFRPYVVRVTTDDLNIRKGPGTGYGVAGSIKNKGAYTIVAESDGAGASRWGKLKSGAGWISLDYCKKV